LSDFLLTLNLKKSEREREREREIPWLVHPLYGNKEKQLKICITAKNSRLKVNPGTDNSMGQSFRATLNRI